MYQYMQSAEETSKEISKAYHKASLVLSNEMDKVFERFVTKHKLSEDDARKLLTSIKDKTSLEEIKAELRKGATGSDKRELLAELESPAYAYRLNRLEDKQQQIDNLMNTIYNREKELSTDHYKELMGESYNRSMYEIQRQAGIGYSFNKLDSKTIDSVLNSKWSGANYSSRIWNNTQKLADSLKTELMVGLLTGEREADIAKNLMLQFASGANNARRLVRTESCHIANEMDMKAYEESGIDTYVFVATLDLRTSAICASLDGKRFKVKDRQSGVNAPPMHPWCRSTTICDISDEELSHMKRRSKNQVTGKTELVPANMTYEEWHKKYIDGKIIEKKVDNEIKNKSITSYDKADIDYRADKVTFKDLMKWKKSIGNASNEEYQIIGGVNENSYIRNANAYKINKAMRDGTVDELSDKNKKTIETLRKVIDKNTSDTDAVLLRKVDYDYLKNVFEIDTEDVDTAVKKLNEEKLGNTVIEKGFLSTSYKANKNFNKNDKVELEILAPKGTKMYLTMNRDESEIILQAGTNLRFEGATVNDGNIKMQMRVVKTDVDIKDKSSLQLTNKPDKISLKDRISEQNIEIDDLKKQFSNAAGGYSYYEWFKTFDSVEDGFGGILDNDKTFEKLKNLDEKIRTASSQRTDLLIQKERRGQLDTGYKAQIPDDELDAFNKRAFEQIKLDTGYSDEKAKDFQDVIKEYFGGDYKSILAGENEKAKTIRDGIDLMPVYNGSISRGMTLDNSSIKMFTDLKVGDELPQKGIIESWTSERNTAIAYGGISDYERSSVILECANNKTGVGVQHLSSFGTVEAEVLSSSKYEVVEMTTESKYDYLSKHKEYLYFPEDLENVKEILRRNEVCIIKVKEKS